MPDQTHEVAASAPRPSFVLDLSKSKEDGKGCFLTVYTLNDNLVDLSLVSGEARRVFSTGITGLESCVRKPQSRKGLKTADHLAKVKQALKAVATAASAADAADAGGGGGGGPPSAATASAGPKATLAWEIVAGKDGGADDSAKLTVKEVKKVGAIDLAVITLPAVKEAVGGELLTGLLLGAVVEAHKRTRQAEAMERERAKAHGEKVKVQGLLDGVIRDKRQTLTRVMEKAVLVVNAKKDRIDYLENQLDRLEAKLERLRGGGSGGSGGEEGDDDRYDTDSGGSGREADDDVGTDDDEGGSLARGTGKGKSKGKEKEAPRSIKREEGGAAGAGAGAGAGARRSSTAGNTGDKGRRGRGGGGGGGGAKVKTEPGLMGECGGALATPIGTQELSQEELHEFVGSQVKTEDGGAGLRRAGGAVGSKPGSGGGGGRPRTKRPVPGGDITNVEDGGEDGGDGNGGHEDDDDDDDSAGGGGTEAAMYVGDLSDSGSVARERPKKRKKKRISKKPATPAAGTGSGGGSSGAGAAAVAAAAAGGSGTGNSASGAVTPPPVSLHDIFEDGSSDDLDGIK